MQMIWERASACSSSVLACCPPRSARRQPTHVVANRLPRRAGAHSRQADKRAQGQRNSGPHRPHRVVSVVSFVERAMQSTKVEVQSFDKSKSFSPLSSPRFSARPACLHHCTTCSTPPRPAPPCILKTMQCSRLGCRFAPASQQTRPHPLPRDYDVFRDSRHGAGQVPRVPLPLAPLGPPPARPISWLRPSPPLPPQCPPFVPCTRAPRDIKRRQAREHARTRARTTPPPPPPPPARSDKTQTVETPKHV